MLEIKNGKVFIKGKETTNPELIGLTVLDMADNPSPSKEKTKRIE